MLYRKVDSSLRMFGENDVKCMGMGYSEKVSQTQGGPLGVTNANPGVSRGAVVKGCFEYLQGTTNHTVTEDNWYYGIFSGRWQYRVLRKHQLLLNYRKSLNQVEVEPKVGFPKLSLSKEHLMDKCFGEQQFEKMAAIHFKA